MMLRIAFGVRFVRNGGWPRSELFLTLRADPAEEDVVPGDRKAVCVMDGALQPCDIVHLNVEYAAALVAAGVVVVVAAVIVPIRAARHRQPADLALLRQLVEVAVDRRPADVGVLRRNGGLDLVRRGVALKPVHRFVHQGALNGVSPEHQSLS